jgi:hypothetical protein
MRRPAATVRQAACLDLPKWFEVTVLESMTNEQLRDEMVRLENMQRLVLEYKARMPEYACAIMDILHARA